MASFLLISNGNSRAGASAEFCGGGVDPTAEHAPQFNSRHNAEGVVYQVGRQRLCFYICSREYPAPRGHSGNGGFIDITRSYSIVLVIMRYRIWPVMEILGALEEKRFP